MIDRQLKLNAMTNKLPLWLLLPGALLGLMIGGAILWLIFDTFRMR